ncbi:MAG: GNAT family N-acetyltransferase [Lysobacterales bacterium]
MKHLLDNIIWNSLSGPQQCFSVGTSRARRYTRGFSPIVGFADPDHPEFADLIPYCEPDEHFYVERWAGAAPDGWQIDVESHMCKMTWDGPAPDSDEAPDAIALGPEHAEQAVALAQLTQPGPFGLRTIELGEYYGYFEGSRLIAMAGERMHAGTLREISGVCTHPDFQGRGHARRLMNKLIRIQMRRGQTPFLHVMSANEGAHALYLKMGFVDYREVVVRVVSRR